MTAMSAIVTTALYTDAGLFSEETCASVRTVSSCPPAFRVAGYSEVRVDASFRSATAAKPQFAGYLVCRLRHKQCGFHHRFAAKKPSVTCVCPPTPRPPTEKWLQLQTPLPRAMPCAWRDRLWPEFKCRGSDFRCSGTCLQSAYCVCRGLAHSVHSSPI